MLTINIGESEKIYAQIYEKIRFIYTEQIISENDMLANLCINIGDYFTHYLFMFN